MTERLPTPDTSSSTATTTKRPKSVISRRNRRRPEPTIDPTLLTTILQESNLPRAYEFDIAKTIQRIQTHNAQHVALQLPEGLLLYATVLGDIFQRFGGVLQVSILGDVTYGACCVDDITARALGADLLIHYGHSCLVPIQHTVVPTLYIFCEILWDAAHMVDCLVASLLTGPSSTTTTIHLLGTVQFRHALVEAQQLLEQRGYSVIIPQAKPLSPGEVLGCTSPCLAETGVVLFVADGRFHLEATMIANPHIQQFYRYDPYSKKLTIEEYHHNAMKDLRWQAIATAQRAHSFGILLGTLGRQGNPAIVQRIRDALRRHAKRSFLVLISEITPAKLLLLPAADAFVQVACPRLSVDWGHCFGTKPVLTPYELFVCLDETKWQDTYPMDYYALAGGPWSNYHGDNKNRKLENSAQGSAEPSETGAETHS